MKQVYNVEELREQITNWTMHEESKIVLVPTMGALHEGHLTLMRFARELGNRVIVSIFVNPTQFNDSNDFQRYPRDESKDLALLRQEKVDMVFTPSPEVMYPQPFMTTVSVPEIAKDMEGAHRPGHFDGVATIVTKLLLQTLPDFAVFGEKDFQQFCLIETLARDLNIPVTIVGAKTVRDEHGLALSSRNVLLSEQGLEQARKLNKVLFSLANAIQKGEVSIAQAQEVGLSQLADKGFDQVDYLELRDDETLKPLSEDSVGRKMRLLTAVHVEGVRLIDNVPVNNSSNWISGFGK